MRYTTLKFATSILLLATLGTSFAQAPAASPSQSQAPDGQTANQPYPAEPPQSRSVNSICSLKNQMLQTRLLSPVSTATARPGDTFTVSVDGPPAFQGGIVEGKVDSLTKAERGFGKGQPKIQLSFTALTVAGRTCGIAGELKEVSNSKGVKHVDEEGRAVGRTSNKKRIGGTIGGALLGAGIGALSGGPAGAAAGGAAGAATGFLLSSTMTTAGTDIEFLPGSLFTLEVSAARAQRAP